MVTEQIKRLEMDFFNGFSNDSYDMFSEQSYQKLRNIFASLMNGKDEIIVDLGCGSGAFSKYLAKFHTPIVGIDLCFNLLITARNKIKNARFILGDGECLPLLDESIDLITLSGFLHHLPDMEKTVKEIYRVLRKGGKCFAYDPNNRNPIMWLYRDKRSPIYSNKGITSNERTLKAEEIITIFSKTGFKVAVSAISGLSYKDVKDSKMTIFLPIYNAIDKLLTLMPLSNKYGSFLITLAEK